MSGLCIQSNSQNILKTTCLQITDLLIQNNNYSRDYEMIKGKKKFDCLFRLTVLHRSRLS